MSTIFDFSVGERVQAHPATDTWARGDRFGTIERISLRRITKEPVFHVRMDTSGRVVRFSGRNLLAI